MNITVYLSNLLIRFDDHSKLKEEETFGFAGILVDLTLVKSRNSRAGQSVTLVFNQSDGYDADLSLFILLKEHKMINGAGAHLYIGDRSDIKFSQKQLKTKLKENPELREIFMTTCMTVLRSLIVESKQEMYDEDEFDITKAMRSLIAC